MGIWTALVTGVFIVSLVGKLISPLPTLEVLISIWGFDTASAHTVFDALLVTELSIIIGLAFSRTRKIYLVPAILFIVAVSTSVIRQMWVGSDLGCGCGAGFDTGRAALNQSLTLLRNFLLVLLCWLQLRSTV